MSKDQTFEENKVKVILESIPDEEARQKCIALLVRLFRKVPQEKIAQKLDRLPFLVGSFPVSKAEQLTLALRRCGAKVHAVSIVSESIKKTAGPGGKITAAPVSSQSSKWAGLLALVLMISGGSYWYFVSDTTGPESEAVVVQPVEDSDLQPRQEVISGDWSELCSSASPIGASNPVTILDVEPHEMRGFLERAYRLSPDKRLTHALCHVSWIATGTVAKILYRYHQGQWEFVEEGVEIGKVSVFPDYSEITVLAGHYATLRVDNNNNQSRLPSASMEELRRLVDSFWVPAQFEVLRKLDSQLPMTKTAPESFQVGAQAMLNILLQTLDRVGMSDDLAARTLALIALGESAGREMARESALLAKLMGYEAAAYRLAETLDDEGGVKHYVQGRERRLLVLAARKDSSLDTRFFQLDSLAHQREIEPWAEWANARFGPRPYTLALIKSALDLNDFTFNPLITRWLPNLVLMEMALASGSLKPSSEWPGLEDLSTVVSFSRQFKARAELLALGSDPLVKRFEQEMQRLGERPAARFMDPTIEQDYYASAFWSSQRIRGLHYLDRLSSEEASRIFADELGSGDSAISQQFLHWYQHLADSKSGNSTAQVFSDDLEKLNAIRWPLLRRSLRERRKYLSYGDPMTSRIIKQAVRHMDSRPGHRYDLASYADEMLYDLPLATRLYRSLVETAPSAYVGVKVWLDGHSHDVKALRVVLNDETQTETVRLNAFKWLRELEVPVLEESQRLFRSLIAKDPDNWTLRRRIVDYLEEQQDYSAARNYIEPWIAAHDRSAGFPWLFANTALARMHYQEGNFQKAWEILEPLIQSQQFGVMRWGALTLNAMGQTDAAATLAKAAYERYPDLLKALMLNLELDWRNVRYVQAANLLKSHRQPIGSENWRWEIGPLFNKIFPDKLLTQGKAAAQALADAGIGAFELQQLSFALKDAGNLPLAFDIGSRLRWSGMGQLDLTIGAYGVLKEWRGSEAALEWVRKQIPARAVNRASTMLYASSHYELLWGLIGEPLPNDYPEFVWLMRAAATVQEGLGESPYRSRLEAYYRDPSREYYHMIGRYLLGLENEETLLGLATDSDKRCEVAYYLAIKAESEGRLQDASDWYHVAVETGLRKEGECRWAYNRLSNWRNKRERAFFP